jgi:hypothetical protein
VIGVRWINLEVKEYSRKDARFSSNCLHWWTECLSW